VVIPLTIIISLVRNLLGLCGIEVCTSLDQYNQQVQAPPQQPAPQQPEPQQPAPQQTAPQQQVVLDITRLMDDPATRREESEMRRALQESADEAGKQNTVSNNSVPYGSTGTSQQVVVDV